MSVARELFRLQEIDRELASGTQTRAAILGRLEGNKEIAKAQSQREAAKKQAEEHILQQRKIELQIEEISEKLSKFEEELYSGRTTNTKELSGLQKEIEILKPQREKLEDQALEMMESVERSNTSVADIENTLRQLEESWVDEQKKLNEELNEIEKVLSVLTEKRNAAAGAFDAGTLEIYEELKKKRGTAVAKVERGICQGCRIQLPVNELQQVRSGQMVRCSSCGRILFMDQ